MGVLEKKRDVVVFVFALLKEDGGLDFIPASRLLLVAAPLGG